MATPAHTTQTWRFGVFEVDAQLGELRRAGLPIKLREQCLRILILLLEHEGQIVTREELRKALWPADTFVDFDHSLNAAVMKLREALGDTAEKPLYIDTIPKRGYRFIAPVAYTPTLWDEVCGTGAKISDRQSDKAHKDGRVPLSKSDLHLWVRRRWRVIAGWAGGLMAIAAMMWNLGRPLPSLRIPDYIQLTSDGRLKTIEGTDGNNIYLNLWSPAGHATVPVSGGSLREFSIDLQPTKEHNPIILGVSPDGSALLVGTPEPMSGRKLWVIGTHGWRARYLARDCRRAAWSPDGRTVVYSTAHGDIYTVPSSGGEPRLLLAWPTKIGNGGAVYDLAWSPDGHKIRFVLNGRYWEVLATGSNAHEVLPNWRVGDSRHSMWSGQWTPDGHFFLFVATDAYARSQIWALDERHRWLTRPSPEPIQLTSGTTYWGGMTDANIADEGNLAISTDGKKVYSTGSTAKGQLLIYDAKSKKTESYFGGISAEFVDFTRDSKCVVYVTFPEGIMWRANRDGTGLMQLTNPPVHPINPRWSPDGTQIVFSASSPSGRAAIYTVSNEGGTPKRLLPDDADVEDDPTWSPDGKRIVYSSGFGRFRILEPATGRITDIPFGPRDLFSPRWSPDGRYILGLSSRDVVLFDQQTNRWSMLHARKDRFWCNWPSWSHDGRFIYFLNIDVADFHTEEPGVYRIPVTGGKPEKVADLKGFVSTGSYGFWSGLDPKDNPIFLRDASAREIYALTLERQ